jgi:hypothetical protein
MTADIVERLRVSCERLANTKMNMSLEDWDRVSAPIVEAADEIERLRAALREIADMDEVALVEWKKGDGWLHQKVARAALGGSDG